jgi:hypothetical protein
MPEFLYGIAVRITLFEMLRVPLIRDAAEVGSSGITR